MIKILVNFFLRIRKNAKIVIFARLFDVKILCLGKWIREKEISVSWTLNS
jgi:hypothetical protein